MCMCVHFSAGGHCLCGGKGVGAIVYLIVRARSSIQPNLVESFLALLWFMLGLLYRFLLFLMLRQSTNTVLPHSTAPYVQLEEDC